MVLQVHNNRQRFHIDKSREGYRFRLWRLYDDEFVPLRRHSQALREDGFDFVMLQRRSNLGLAEIFVSLNKLLGDSGRYFDDYKGSFGFPLLLVLEKGEKQGIYVLNLHDWRGGLELSPSRVLLGEARRRVEHPEYIVTDPLFGHQPMSWLSGYLFGMLEGYFETACQDYSTPFYRVVESNGIIYGYRTGKGFFTECPEDPEVFAEILAACKREMEDVDGDRLAILYSVTGDEQFKDPAEVERFFPEFMQFSSNPEQ